MNFKVKSEVIPNNIEVLNIGPSVISVAETNLSGNYDISPRRNRRNLKLILRSNHIDWWSIRYKDTLDSVPSEEAITILDNLIKNGFDVEVSTFGKIQGSSYIFFLGLMVEVTRVTK